MNTLYAQLGNTPDLSRLELEAVTGHPAVLILPTVARVNTTDDAEVLGERLGGTLKLVEVLQDTTDETLHADLVTLIAASDHKNVALTALSAPGIFTKSDVHAIKKQVVLVRPVRFLSLEVQGHSLVALKKQHVAEFCVLSDDGVLKIGITRWIHDADEWTVRDRTKPYHDIKRGMLPPKVARIMANLAVGGRAGLSLSDPFCGTGTVLTEAALIGCTKLYGSDTAPEAVEGTARNLAWTKETYPSTAFESQLTVTDATHLDEVVSSVDAIATEPYMGPLIDNKHLPTRDKIKNIARGLSKLYLGSLRSWHKIIKTREEGGGRVVISIPSFVTPSYTITTLTVDDYARLGYNHICSVAYGKPGVTVVRNITILEKK
jgi:tRNA G10  N-methylase Trm11